MPTYVYQNCKTGKQIELYMPICEMERRQSRDGTILLEDGSLCHRVYNGSTVPNDTGRTPEIVSRSMGVHPSQISAASKRDAELGCSVRFDRRGHRIFENRQHLNKWLKAHKAHDFTGCFKDD